MDEILKKHPKGRDYAKIVKDFPLFPLIVDDDDHVLSFPPIINGERTRVTIDTKNILLDTTAPTSGRLRLLSTSSARRWPKRARR